MFSKGKFSSSVHPGAVKSSGSKAPPAPKPEEKGQAPHGDVGEKHVTQTHPGKTQPHPSTGVHAFMGMHKGGGKYESHTHHDGGEVEVKQHPSAGDMNQAQQQALPDDGGAGDNDQGPDNMQDGMDMSQNLGGVGGTY